MKARLNLRADCRRLGSLPLFNHPPLLFGDSRAPATANPPILELDGVRRRYQHSAPVGRSRTETVAGTFHATAIKSGSVQNASVGNYVLALYAKARKSGDARKLFGVLPVQDVRGWTILLSSFARDGSCGMVLDLFRAMVIEGVCPNHFTLSSVLKCCSGLNELKLGKVVHGWIIRNQIHVDAVLANSILDVYAKCGDVVVAERLFDLMRDKNTISWNVMIGAYLRDGDTEKSFNLFQRMPSKDVASWNTIIDGLMQNGLERSALELLYEMKEKGPVFNEVTFSIALGLASILSLLDVGRQVHGIVIRLGINSNEFIRTSLIDMYCKGGETEKASIVFNRWPLMFMSTENSEIAYKDAYACSSLVSGYVKNGNYENAFEVFNTMVQKCMKVDKFTITSIISASANVGILELGRKIHAYILKVGYYLDVHLSSSLIDMYSKCGSLDDALSVFKQSQDSNVVLWTSMIFSFALHGRGKEAVRLVECMINKGIIPNEITFVGILTACSHTGLLEEGREYFRLMKDVYGIKPGIEHYACMVDLYGRSGLLNEAKEFIYSNGISDQIAIWKSFLSSCQLHKRGDMGKWVSEKLIQLNSLDQEPYVLLSNMYATDQKWEQAALVRNQMQKGGLKKHPGQSWIQVNGQVHAFMMGDYSHPQAAEVHSYLGKLIG
ncbi:putative pentatricopeptide repeat-containing protein At3g23330 isoform X1 [Eucalyptus grandis]|uniref:putative pentatricopeptide repeat-containing protein At3g23330 isoform X1 n=1 Tax=Eucalyptus grandis TaxID=71139 RepID=UPI00192EEB4E|nr:putative pentatricopeptide repeat-containing protein At3g23330 isoform X1 [Eucalyptus grandis]XP_039168206.1 putative pentatricopeptide repeat-containing protein At3g23330 isoform X1 [Eucalyptus grandis]XP_039168207.1 putative pentatricopeptide repeat-containing protein At3g23330 isoform X1 [Eucalyptus grandis]